MKYHNLCDNMNITELCKHSGVKLQIKKKAGNMEEDVLEKIASKHEKVQRGVRAIMGGQILEYRKQLYRELDIKISK